MVMMMMVMTMTMMIVWLGKSGGIIDVISIEDEGCDHCFGDDDDDDFNPMVMTR